MIIQSKRVWIGGQFIPAQIEIENDKILNVTDYNEKTVDVDYGNKRITPGFIDLHAHGAYGCDTNDADPQSMKVWLEKLPNEGVTTILPTTVTDSVEVLTASLKNIAAIKKEDPKGAKIHGAHFEGPYLDMDFKGAQPAHHIAKADLDEFKAYQEAAEGLIKYMTIAPEHDENHELIQYASQHGVTVSIGHSGATYQQAVLAQANGATSFTHAFNGMSALNHREPSNVGAMMRSNAFAEIIADGNHVVAPVVNILFKTKPHDMILITDSLSLKGMPVGDYKLGDNTVVMHENGTAYIKGTDTISGSTLRINEGLRNLIEIMDVPQSQAIAAATINPARALKIDDHKGLIQTGYDADIVVLNDDYTVEQTYVMGSKQL